MVEPGLPSQHATCMMMHMTWHHYECDRDCALLAYSSSPNEGNTAFLKFLNQKCVSKVCFSCLFRDGAAHDIYDDNDDDDDDVTLEILP